MYEIYEELPFGVLILEKHSFYIKYINDKFSQDFNVENNILNNNVFKVKDLNIMCKNLDKALNNEEYRVLKRVDIYNRYYDIIINFKENHIEIFTYEITSYVNKEIKVKEDNEKFLGVSTEIKTKYDIVKRIRTIEREYLKKLRDIINNISEGIIVFDKNKEFIFCNESSLKITGLNAEDFKNIRDILGSVEVVDYDNYGENLEKIFSYFLNELTELDNLVVRIYDCENKEKYITVNLNYVLNDDKQLVYIVISLKDITDIKLKEIMIKKQNNELEEITKTKDEFFNMISHELRTPLTVIYSSLQLANDVYGEDITPNIEKVLVRVNQNCSRLLKLINNTLDISKAEAGFLNLNYTVFDVVYSTENIVTSINLYAKSKGVNLIFDTNVEECYVKLDKDKYEKIILNLISNAIKFTPSEKNIWIIFKSQKNTFSVAVRDEGIGIPEDKIHNIFDRFSQINNSLCRNVQGTGLGLALVKSFVDIMKGNIKVKSTEGKGTEFRVSFRNSIVHKDLTSQTLDYGENIKDKVTIEFSDVL